MYVTIKEHTELLNIIKNNDKIKEKIDSINSNTSSDTSSEDETIDTTIITIINSNKDDEYNNLKPIFNNYLKISPLLHDKNMLKKAIYNEKIFQILLDSAFIHVNMSKNDILFNIICSDYKIFDKVFNHKFMFERLDGIPTSEIYTKRNTSTGYDMSNEIYYNNLTDTNYVNKIFNNDKYVEFIYKNYNFLEKILKDNISRYNYFYKKFFTNLTKREYNHIKNNYKLLLFMTSIMSENFGIIINVYDDIKTTIYYYENLISENFCLAVIHGKNIFFLLRMIRVLYDIIFIYGKNNYLKYLRFYY